MKYTYIDVKRRCEYIYIYTYIYVHEGTRPSPLGRTYMYITNDMPSSPSVSGRAELWHNWECH